MKKRILCLLLICAAFMLVPGAGADTEFSYAVLEDGTMEIKGQYGMEDNNYLELPWTIDGKDVTSIGLCALSELNAVKIALPPTLRKIDQWAFEVCQNLESITLPHSMAEIVGNPFRCCQSLKSVYISPDHPVFAVIDGVLFNKEDKRLICYPAGKEETSYTVPQGTRIIGEESLSCCDNLNHVEIPGSVKTIEAFAFAYCQNLQSISIADGVESIGDEAFLYTPSLTRINLPTSITMIHHEAFASRSTDLIVTVPRNSYAAQYCFENGIKYAYADENNDWLNN